MKTFRLFFVLIPFTLVVFLSSDVFGFGCTADDPGECVAECPDGSPCCVGTSPDCSEDPFENARWISCGDGNIECTPIIK